MKFVADIVPVLGPEIGASFMYGPYGVTLCVYAGRRLVLVSLYWSEW